MAPEHRPSVVAAAHYWILCRHGKRFDGVVPGGVDAANGWWRRAALTVAGSVGALAALILGLALNPATGEARWPGVLDVLRRHAWPVVGAMAVLTLVVVPASVLVAPQSADWPASEEPCAARHESGRPCLFVPHANG